jgi:hypothetical protein
MPMKCPVCGSEALSVETRFNNSSPNSVVFAKAKWYQEKPGAMVNRCRLCRDCGYVLLFAGGVGFEQLQENWDKLEPEE